MRSVYGKMNSHDARKRLSTMRGNLLALFSAPLCAYRRRRVPLLFWSALCFFGLMLDNAMLYADLHVFPEVRLVMWRKIPGLIATVLLLFGLIWESE